eukprot:ANDGO_02546.mRNA.1 Nuclear transcription factor Y subunit B-4
METASKPTSAVRDDEDPLMVPQMNLLRMMKSHVPENTKIANEAKRFAQIAATELIAFLTSEAADIMVSKRRRILTGDDLVMAARNLGFDNYAGPLQEFLSTYKCEMQAGRPSNAAASAAGLHDCISNSSCSNATGSEDCTQAVPLVANEPVIAHIPVENRTGESNGENAEGPMRSASCRQ